MISINQLLWCNSFLGSTKKTWNNNMSFFFVGYKLDVFFFNLTYLNFMLLKSLNIIKQVTNKKKKIIFILPELVLKKSRLNFYIKNYVNENIRNLTIISKINWIFGVLTNFKIVNKNYKILPISTLPNIVFIFTNKIFDDTDYINILSETNKLNILSFGLVDSDQNPLVFDYPIPSNSKSFETVSFFYRSFMSYLYICNLKIQSKFFFNLVFNIKNNE